MECQLNFFSKSILQTLSKSNKTQKITILNFQGVRRFWEIVRRGYKCNIVGIARCDFVCIFSVFDQLENRNSIELCFCID